MPDQTEREFGKTIEYVSTKCSHSQAVLSLGKGKGICIDCKKKVKVGTVEVRDPQYMNSLGEIMPYEKRVWVEDVK